MECYVLIMLHIVLIKGNKQEDIMYNINYINVIKREFISIGELGKKFNLFSNNIDCKSLSKVE